MSSDPNAVASLLERMENNGWLERKPHETDRRISASSSCQQVVKYSELRDCAVDLQGDMLALSPRTAAMPFWKNSRVADACHAAAAEAGRKSRLTTKKTPRRGPPLQRLILALIAPTGFRLRLAVIFIRSGVRIGILAAVFVGGIFELSSVVFSSDDVPESPQHWPA